MKILHTADWHIGSKLQGMSRKGEQQAVLDEIIDIAESEKVDAVFVCGDVFHHTNSAGYADKMVIDALLRLADGGRRCVVVIIGNHDDADRLTVFKQFAEKENIFLVDSLNYNYGLEFENKFKINLVECGKGYLTFKKGSEKMVVNLMPYPSGWFNQEKTIKGEDQIEKLARLYSCGATLFEKDSINISVGHFFTQTQTIKSDIYFNFPKDKIPKSDYVALGHVHDGAAVNEKSNIYYCGSPYQVNITENENRFVNVVSFDKSKKAVVKKVKLSAHKKIAVVEVDGMADAKEKLKAKKDYLVSLKATADSLSAAEIKLLQEANPNIFAFNIIPNIKKTIDLTKKKMTEKQVFEAFCKAKGAVVDSALLKTFEAVFRGGEDEIN